jgi:hypothetical protein
LRPFLQGGFCILGQIDLLGQQGRPLAFDELTGRLYPAVEKQGGNHGLASIRQQATISSPSLGGFTAQHAQILCQADRLGNARQGLPADQGVEAR